MTGVVAIACARHGCFAPNGLVNLFKGEQQKNVDWAFLQALKATAIEVEQGALLIYDIICQYFVYFLQRIGHLLPAGLEVDRGIGSFHVHGHKEECLYRYSTSFIPFAGVTAGEILESLWSNMNAISPAVRTATLAHRAEVLDDHASDSNYKKTIGIRKSIVNVRRQSCRHLYRHSLLQIWPSQNVTFNPNIWQLRRQSIFQVYRSTSLKLHATRGSARYKMPRLTGYQILPAWTFWAVE